CDNDGEVVWRLDFGDIAEIRTLQALLVSSDTIYGINHVFAGERSTVVKPDSFSQVQDPFFSLKFPRFGKHSEILAACVADLDKRLDHVLPDAVMNARADRIRVQAVQADAAQNRHAIFRGRISCAHKGIP